MKLAIFGATGGAGRHLAEQALATRHEVRALVRFPDRAGLPDTISLVAGNALDAKAVADTVSGADAVLSCLGTRLTATLTHQGRIVAPGTKQIVEAMRERNIRRLIAISTYGAGDSRPRLSLIARLAMESLLWGELADKNAMEAVIMASGLDWTIMRPVNLTDRPASGRWTVDDSGQIGFGDWIPRADVASAMLAAASDPNSIGRALLVKGAPKTS